eukprot:4320424-Pyramimonas_sp.AAC.1
MTSRKRTSEWFSDSAECSLRVFDVSDAKVPRLLASLNASRPKGGQCVARAATARDTFPDIRIGDRICSDFPPERR